jgi:DegV family protein with EDD domain
MNKFKIIADTSCDFTPELFEENGVDLVPFYFSFDGEKYYKEHIDMSVDEFYARLITSKKAVKTSLPNADEFRQAMLPYAEKGQDIILLTISSKFSGAYQSAVAAQGLIAEAYPNVKTYIVDSQLCTGGFALVVWKLIEMRNSGMDAKSAYEAIQKYIPGTLISFTFDSLEYLQRGGRLGKGAAYIGTLLNIKPVMQMFDGELQPISKQRGRKKAMAAVIDSHMKKIDDKDKYDWVFIHSQCPDEAREFQRDFSAKYGLHITHEPISIGTTIGVHIGPSVIGLCSCLKSAE